MLIRRAMEKEASDMHWTVGQRPHMRCEGVLAPVDGRPLTEPFMAGFCAVIMDEEQRKRLAREKDIALLISIHEIDLAEQVADRILCLKNGRIQAAGRPEAVLTDGCLEELFDISPGGYRNRYIRKT